MKLAIAQLNPTIGDLAGNAQQILIAAEEAAKQGARLLLTPELSICGYPPRDLLMQPSFVEAIRQTVHDLAAQMPPQLAVLVGMVEPNGRSRQEGGKPLFNSIALIENRAVQQIFHKRLLPTYDVFDEARYFEPGMQSNAFMVDGVSIGVTICEDIWNDEEFWGKRHYTANPIEDLAVQGVDLIVNLSASPYSVNKQQLREAMLQHAARRYQQPIIYANQVGGNDDLIFDGSSVAFNHQGDLVGRAKAFEADLLVLEFNQETRDLTASGECAIALRPQNSDAEIWSALVLGIRDYVRKCGFSKVVMGLSGGIDSSLVAAIATAALGPDQVLGVLMPSPYSSDHSISDAQKLAQNLGIQTELLPIAPLMQTYDQTFAKLFAGTDFGIAEENIQSRIRGNVLMAISNKFGHLLISTGNKSEMAVGYCTLYGDMNGGLAAIADVPKTRVYSICQWLNTTAQSEENREFFYLLNPNTREIIPAHVISKPPSAELKPGQVDQDSLPPYEILDDILHRLLQDHQSPADIAAAGHDPAITAKVGRLVTRAEFKRKQAPPGLKVTDRAFGTGWRMPIANQWLIGTLPQTTQQNAIPEKPTTAQAYSHHS